MNISGQLYAPAAFSKKMSYLYRLERRLIRVLIILEALVLGFEFQSSTLFLILGSKSVI
jgi:hypothetical protein